MNTKAAEKPFEYTRQNMRDSVRQIMDHAKTCKPGETISYRHEDAYYWNRIIFLSNVGLYLSGKRIVLRWTGKFEVTVDKEPDFDMKSARRKLHHNDKLEMAIMGNPLPDTILRSMSQLDENPVPKNDSIGKMRNSPCICGSGKKFKKCCMGELKNKSVFINELEQKNRDANKIDPLEVKA